MKKLVLALALLVVITGCSSVSKKDLADGQEIVMSKTKTKKPKWTVSSVSVERDFPNYILAVGIAESRGDYNIKSLIREAEGDAKQQLSSFISVDVDGSIVIDKNSNSGNGKDSFSNSMRNEIKQKTDN